MAAKRLISDFGIMACLPKIRLAYELGGNWRCEIEGPVVSKMRYVDNVGIILPRPIIRWEAIGEAPTVALAVCRAVLHKDGE